MLAASPLIARVAAVGDRRPYIVALVVLDPDAAAFFAAQHGISDPSPRLLASHTAACAAVAAAVKTATSTLPRAEQIKRFTILPVLWQPGDDEITPTMKLRRRAVAAKYADAIESMYATSGMPLSGAYMEVQPGDWKQQARNRRLEE